MLLAAGCAPPGETIDAGNLDAGNLDAGNFDAGNFDAGVRDAGPTALDNCPAADISSWGFDDGGWGPYQPVDGMTEQIVADPSARGGFSVRTQYHLTTGNGMAGGVDARFDSRASTHLFARWSYKQQDGFDNSGIKKYLRFQGVGFNGLFGTLINNRGRLDWTWDGDPSDYYVGSPTPDALRGSWHWYEIENDLTASPVIGRMWVDGVLVVDASNTTVTPGTVLGVIEVAGIFNAPSADGSDWIDDVAISRHCIAPP
jgi:hypothetical protein